jgi:hypothetical protein
MRGVEGEAVVLVNRPKQIARDELVAPRLADHIANNGRVKEAYRSQRHLPDSFLPLCSIPQQRIGGYDEHCDWLLGTGDHNTRPMRRMLDASTASRDV